MKKLRELGTLKEWTADIGCGFCLVVFGIAVGIIAAVMV